MTSTSTQTRVAIYIRISRDMKGERLGVERQLEACEKMVARLGHEVVAVYDDNDISATSGKRRPGYEKLLEAIRNREIDAIACWHVDRLYRTLRDLVRLLDATKGIDVLVVNGGDIDLSTSTGRMVAGILGSVATKEVAHAGERKIVANEQRARAGKAWVGRTFGIDGDVLVESEAAVIRQGCDALLNGASLRGLATQWNAEGIKSVKGYRWTGGTVRQVLMRASNAGLQTYNGVILDGKDAVETAWPAIVSRDTWESVCSKLADPKRHTGKTEGRKHLLTGIAICGKEGCGKRLGTTNRVTKRGVKKPIYTCKHCFGLSRDLAQVDDVVVDTISERLRREDAHVIFAGPRVDRKALVKQANLFRDQIAAAQREYDEGIIDGRRLKGREETVQPKLDAVNAKLLGANTSKTLKGLLGPDAPLLLADLPLDRKRAVIDTVCNVTIEKAGFPGEHFRKERITVDFDIDRA